MQGYSWMTCVYDKDNMSANNTSESDPRSYEVTEAVTNKAQKQFWGSIQTHDLRDTGAMLYRAMKPRWKQVKCEFNIYPLYQEKGIYVHNEKIIWVRLGKKIQVNKVILAVMK